MKRWSVEQAQIWGKSQPWFFGANFSPSTAINQLEMWQAETFDPETIERELGYAQGIGMNIMRVYLHDLLWEHDRDGFIERMEKYLAIADAKGIRTMFTIFDDCWHGGAGAGASFFERVSRSRCRVKGRNSAGGKKFGRAPGWEGPLAGDNIGTAPRDATHPA